jgi:nucleoside-diphosphate-sugar epimerase
MLTKLNYQYAIGDFSRTSDRLIRLIQQWNLSVNAFITGGTGFLGAHLIHELSNQGWTMLVLRREKSDVSRIEGLPNVNFVSGDITDIESLRKVIPDKIEAVFHLAGSVAINELGTRNMVDVCLEKEVGRFIYTSTVAIFDWNFGPRIDETYPKNEWSDDQYVRSKKLADDEVDIGVKRGLDAVYLHPSAIFGRYDRDGWATVFKEIKKGVPFNMSTPGGGSICNARTVMAAHVKAYHLGIKGERYILGGTDYSWYEVMQKIAGILGVPPLRKPLPHPLFNVTCILDRFFSGLMGKEPLLSKHVQDIVGAYIYSSSGKAVKELEYDISNIDDMLNESYKSLKEEELI